MLLWLILLGLSAYVHAQSTLTKPVILTDAQDKYPLGLHLEILEDPTAELTIEDVSTPEYATQFIPSQTENPKFGFTLSAIWVRFRLRNETLQTNEWRLEHGFANTHHLNMYLPRGESVGSSKDFQVTKTGILHPFDSRDVPYHQLVFKIPLLPDTEQIVYLRIKTESSMPVPLILWHPEIFAQQSRTKMFLTGLFIGALLIIAGYNLFIWLFLKDKSYLYYVLFVLGIILFQMSIRGFTAQYFWPDQFWLNRYAVPFLATWGLIFALKFGITFLATKIHAPRQHKVATFLLILWGLMLAQIPFVDYNFIIRQVSFLAIVTVVLLISLGITTWHNGYRAARYYLLAWIIWLIIIFVWLLAVFGLFGNFVLLQNILPIGLVILMLFLALALADRINIFKQEREVAQAVALQASQENELLVREQNVRLEQQVSERTAELFQAKELAEKARYLAETANRAKSTFLASMSHELRTPLNGILGFAQILQRDFSLPTKQRHGLNVIEQSGHHLLSLINDVLDLAKVESGKIELYKTSFNLSSLISDVSEIIKIRAQQKGIDFYLKSTDESPNGVQGDERRLRQILLNLLGNAIKFTVQGSITLKVSALNSQICFKIEDTGIGISPENIERIFEPFEQVGGQEYQGTGLGLAISKNLVELMGGQLCVSSQINIGTQFWFELALPISDYNVTQVSQQPIIGVKGEPPKILVVDDYLDNQAVLVDLLSPLGFQIEAANNGHEGLEKAIQWQPDVIIADLIMPQMDGFELIHQLRQSPLLKEKIIIASSASVYEEDRKKSLAVGSNAFLPKPIQNQTLFEQLQQLLNLTWIYKDKIKATTEQNHSTQMIFPPVAELEKLYELSLMGDIDELEEQVAILAESEVNLKPFVTKIQAFLKKYQIGKLSKWLKKEITDGS